MQAVIFMFCLLGQTAPSGQPAPARTTVSNPDPLRASYRADAEKCQFRSADKEHPELRLVPQPIMRWATDDDWSGDVFVWASGKQPAVIGCILSGPAENDKRSYFHEFHLLSDKPILPAEMPTGRRWQPKTGLTFQAVPEAPEPAVTATGRLTQMRQLCRQFTAHMRAESDWELRALPQPLYRFGDGHGLVGDGALFAYVWTKGTDPEVILAFECRQTDQGPKWVYAPVRFSTRPVWLDYAGKQVWKVDSHSEPEGQTSDLLYTTTYSRTVARPVDETKTKSAGSK